MGSEEISVKLKEAINRLKAPNKPMIEIKTLIRVRSTLRMAKSTPWYMLTKNDCPDLLSRTNGSRGPQMKSKVHFHKIISIVKNNFTPSNKVRNILKEVDVSVQSSDCRRSSRRSSNTDNKPLVCQKTCEITYPVLKKIFSQMKPRLTYIRIIEREKYGKVNKRLMI